MARQSLAEVDGDLHDLLFLQGLGVHHAPAYFIGFSYNFCWPVRTLRVPMGDDRYQARTPAMAAGLSNHVWTTWEWATYPARPP
ncbi:hypothetical protein ACFL59_03140 [Planctomycetota bacterium]